MSTLKCPTDQCPKSFEVQRRSCILNPQAQKDNAPQAATGEALKTVTQTNQEKGNRMKSTMLPPGRQSAVVLLHPNHSGPAVVNPKIRCPKKGCVNFMKWQRKRDLRRLAEREAELQAYRETRHRDTA